MEESLDALFGEDNLYHKNLSVHVLGKDWQNYNFPVKIKPQTHIQKDFFTENLFRDFINLKNYEQKGWI